MTTEQKNQFAEEFLRILQQSIEEAHRIGVRPATQKLVRNINKKLASLELQGKPQIARLVRRFCKNHGISLNEEDYS